VGIDQFLAIEIENWKLVAEIVAPVEAELAT
jgi:hypothetical protein